MFMASGGDLAAAIHNSRAVCPQCEATIVFIRGVEMARNAGITANVIMCPDCRRVYDPDVGFGSFKCGPDVTQTFADLLRVSRCTTCDGTGRVTRKHVFGLIKRRCKCSECYGGGWRRNA